MRMWMVDPKTMCRKHLLGEHVECHMFAGTIERGISVRGYLDKGLLETHSLQKRHDVLAIEMQRRGYQHQSPLNFSIRLKSKKIDAVRSATELHKRCIECRELGQGAGGRLSQRLV